MLTLYLINKKSFCLLLSLHSHCNENQITFCGHCKITVIFGNNSCTKVIISLVWKLVLFKWPSTTGEMISENQFGEQEQKGGGRLCWVWYIIVWDASVGEVYQWLFVMSLFPLNFTLEILNPQYFCLWDSVSSGFKTMFKNMLAW